MRPLLPDTTMSLIHTLDLCAVAVCAITATLEAHRRDLDLFGVAVIAVISGIGGGTVRDILLGRLPVYWVHDPIYVVVGIAAAVTASLMPAARASRIDVLQALRSE